MITCPNCTHSNPDGAVNCEACFTPLPIVKNLQCPSCNATVLSDAKFCGHCGLNLSTAKAVSHSPENSVSSPFDLSPSVNLSTEVFPVIPISSAMTNPLPDETNENNSVANLAANSQELQNVPNNEEELFVTVEPSNVPAFINPKTQLQQFAASLLHVQTNLMIEIPPHLPVVHIGKPNTVIPPDIDVSGFPDSDIVSRIHADIRTESGFFYFEDTGSSNGTYINNLPLPAGNRHKLRAGDRISLGKGD
ncbi:MAG: FHA domain-containing protein, partial [Pseudanabaena sp.]